MGRSTPFYIWILDTLCLRVHVFDVGTKQYCHFPQLGILFSPGKLLRFLQGNAMSTATDKKSHEEREEPCSRCTHKDTYHFSRLCSVGNRRRYVAHVAVAWMEQ
ncbi:hypothetical protein Dimus_009670 [Dionaea muscipula]